MAERDVGKGVGWVGMRRQEQSQAGLSRRHQE